MAGRVNFYKMEIGPNRELLIELNVSGLPTFLFYKNGRKSNMLAGKNIFLDEVRGIQEDYLFRINAITLRLGLIHVGAAFQPRLSDYG